MNELVKTAGDLIASDAAADVLKVIGGAGGAVCTGAPQLSVQETPRRP
jgi:hypothetical protein